jgi:dienelactone hydrolase
MTLPIKLSRHCFAALLASMLLHAVPAAAQFGATEENVTFNAVGLEQIAIPSAACTGFYGTPSFKCRNITVPGYLARAKTGDNKAMVFISEGAGGLDKRHGDYARWLADHGISAVALDHWSPRGMTEAGVNLNKATENGGNAWNMAIDVGAAALYFKARPEWQQTRFGHLGESMGGSAAMNSDRPYVSRMVRDVIGTTPPDMRAIAALFPACIDRSQDGRFKPIPFLMVSGEKDEITPAWTCEWYANDMNAKGGKVDFMVLPGQHHDWDAPYRLRMAKGPNTSKCSNTRVGDKFIMESNQKEYPATPEGLMKMKEACTTRGFEAGNQGDPKTGYAQWTDFFVKNLLGAAS